MVFVVVIEYFNVVDLGMYVFTDEQEAEDHRTALFKSYPMAHTIKIMKRELK